MDGRRWNTYRKKIDRTRTDLLARVEGGVEHGRQGGRVYLPMPDGSERSLLLVGMTESFIERGMGGVLRSTSEISSLGLGYGLGAGRRMHYTLNAPCLGVGRKRCTGC